ncbi:MAG: N-acetylmuramoyl-L-alanine amidase [Caldiserica bacterium]|jgi:N-acetylmuramoyl-L-alanine amidase|nr:N-acetylmuramoyl-L-alanine amidase [Caldisericota bacterium]
MKIGIDAGHGKDGDPGAIGPCGTKEADITQALALQLGNFILALGQEAFLCDRSLYASERAVQASKEGCEILLSLHCNAGGSQAQGIEAWFAHGNEEGKRLASSILGILISETGAVSRGVKDDADWRPASDPKWTGGMGVLRYFSGPAVLLEFLFISNPVEEKLLASPDFQQKCAHAIALGTLDFINSWRKGSGENGGSRSGSAEGDSGEGKDCSGGSPDSGNSPSSPYPDLFPDLSPPLWEGKARKMVLTLHDRGIVTGYEDGTFRPDQPLTRLEAASLIYRALISLGKLPPLE